MMEEVATAAATGFDKNIVIVVVTMLAGIMTTGLGLLKAGADQKHTLRMFMAQHDVERADREAAAKLAREERAAAMAADKLERQDKARELVETLRVETEAVRARLELSSEAVRSRLDASARDVRDRLDLTAQQATLNAEHVVHAVAVDATGRLAAQTAQLEAAIKAASKVTSVKAEAAYQEANHVNVKIEKLHEHNRVQADALTNLVDLLKERFSLDGEGAAAAAAVAAKDKA